MRACSYCEQPFDERDDWHARHPNLRDHCSHGCLYANGLPLSHAGQSFVSIEALGSSCARLDSLPSVVVETDEEQQAVEAVQRRFVAVIEMLAGMKSGDRDLLLYRLHNRNRTLSQYARSKGITTQAAHRRLVKIIKNHPCVEWAISEHRYRKRT